MLRLYADWRVLKIVTKFQFIDFEIWSPVGGFYIGKQIMCRKFNSFDLVDSPAYANTRTIEEQSLCPAISARQGVTRLTSRPLSTWAVASRVLINKRHIALWPQSSSAVEGVRCAKQWLYMQTELLSTGTTTWIHNLQRFW